MLAIKPFGILVKVGEQIKGLVPSMHLADIMMKNPEKKYSPGDEVKCRVRPWRGPCGGAGERGSRLECLPFPVKFMCTLCTVFSTSPSSGKRKVRPRLCGRVVS